MPESTERGALTEAVFYILLSLLNPLHGYGIMQKVAMLSNNRVKLGSGTLYGAINTLLEKGWICQSTEVSTGRKKAYVITATGKDILKDEIRRLEELIKNGKALLKGGVEYES
ncbi:MAG: helix-turn-helix transcriptional regulator [Spirochaetales bacterium]|nr:helix-turn-helix transcriptional regulator [Spirochaetales bacterium]